MTVNKTFNKPIKFVQPVRTIKVLDAEGNVLWQGETNETKEQIRAKYNQPITVVYNMLYTTVNTTQTYDEALQDANQVSHWAFSLEEFEEWLSSLDRDIDYRHVAYNENNLVKQKKEEVKNTKTSLSIYFYTSLYSGLVNDKFPIKGVTAFQAKVARESLEAEDAARVEFVRDASSNPTEDELKGVQIESVLFLAGSPKLIDWYINSTKPVWIRGANNDRKGIIHSPIKNNYRVTMLLLDVTLDRNKEVMRQVGWL